MPETKISYTDIVSLYKAKFAQTNYPFKHPTNPCSDYQKHEWIRIKIKSDQIHPNLLPLMIAMNEIFRFEIGNTHPECRLSDEYIYSKRVEQDDEVGIYRVRTLFFYRQKMISDEPSFWEGMGRVIFCKYLYQDNDFHLYNGLVDKNQYFVGIDSDKCFWSFTEKYHYGPNCKPENIKVMMYNNTPFATRSIRTNDGKFAHILQDKTRDYIGEMHQDDYETLPLIRHFHPTNWFFLAPELQHYSKKMANNLRFLNEKHFATIKSLVTICIKQLLIDLHLEDAQDKQDMSGFISAQLSKLTEICKQSASFKQYLLTHRLSAIQTILYEIQLFFKLNSAYRLEAHAMQLALQEYFYHDTIMQYANFLDALGTALTTEEKAALFEHAKNIHVSTNEATTIARDFYKNQLMEYHAQESPSKPA